MKFRIGLQWKLEENSHCHMNKNQRTLQSVMLHVKNKLLTRDGMDFGKTMEHEMNIIFDFMANSCKYEIIQCTKWEIPMRVRIDFVGEMIRGCNEVIFWITCYSNMHDIVIIIIAYFMVLVNGNVFSIMSRTLR